MSGKAELIGRLNDKFRKGVGVSCGIPPGRLVLTRGILELPDPNGVVERVRAYDTFTPDSDPYGERDFGNFDDSGMKVFWKIDYYNPSLDGGSEDPSDITQTIRVLTVLLASEY